MRQTFTFERSGGLPPIQYHVEGEGEPLVLIHGVGGDATNWDDVVRRLRPGFQVILPDLRGHGGSGLIRGPISAADLARDVTDTMDHLGVKSARVAGFSLGGLVAQSMALETPARVSRIALVSTVAGRTPEEKAASAGRIQVVKEKGLAAIAAGNRERWFTDAFRQAKPALVEARVRQLQACDPDSYLHAFSVFATGDFADRLHLIRQPAVVITGEHDAAGTARMAQLMHERIPRSALHVLPGLRHSLLIEAPEQIADLLGKYF
jgi:(E)-2-((N-methylformamido)methylene)succinate hydrolase